MRKYYLLIALAVVVLDRLTKQAVQRGIALHDFIQVIPGFFRLTHVRILAQPSACLRTRTPSGSWAC